MNYFYNYKYKEYDFTIVADDEAVLQITFNKTKIENAEKSLTPLIKQTIQQLDEYFMGKRKVFDLPIKPQCSPFQKTVLEKLIQVPYGKTVSYKELATYVGNSKASRAVGMANRNNPIAIVIPCHRVIGSGGKLTGYAGGLELKSELLELEKKNLKVENTERKNYDNN